MTYMSVEAVTAGLVLTGLVHADPHEGNIMLADDGRLVFLDFGLMSRVEGDIMEAFASGIQALLNRDYEALVQAFIDRHHPPPPPTASHRLPPPSQAFIDTGFVGTPIECRENEKQPFRPGSAEDMVVDLRQRMETVGTPHAPSRCGAPTPVARAPPRSLPAAR